MTNNDEWFISGQNFKGQFVISSNGKDGFTDIALVEREKDALIIQAAHEMLEALTYAKMDLKGLLELFGNRMEPEARIVIEGTISDAEAALARAKCYEMD